MVTLGPVQFAENRRHTWLAMHPSNGLLTALDLPSEPHRNNSSSRCRP